MNPARFVGLNTRITRGMLITRQPSSISHIAQESGWTKDPSFHRWTDANGNIKTVDMDGSIRYYDKLGKLHRDNDQPAIIMANSGGLFWYQHGEKHRDGGPACLPANGDAEWYQHGELHRENGPASTTASGIQLWYRYGKLHRTDGPAIERPDGTKEWWVDGKKHRIDGPAVIGLQETAWYQNDQLHRDNGPAVEHSNGTKVWFDRGMRSRLDGPAVEMPDGTKEFWLDGIHIYTQHDDDIPDPFISKVLYHVFIDYGKEEMIKRMGLDQKDTEPFSLYDLSCMVDKLPPLSNLSKKQMQYVRNGVKLQDSDVQLEHAIHILNKLPSNMLIALSLPPNKNFIDVLVDQLVQQNPQTSLREIPKLFARHLDLFDKNFYFNDKLADFINQYVANNSADEVVAQLRDWPHGMLQQLQLPATVVSALNNPAPSKDKRIRKFFETQKPVVVAQNTSPDQPVRQVDSNGTVYHYLHGKFHRLDGPAIENANGTKEWWVNGERHRADGPAVEQPHGTTEWWLNGKKHREDGPAIEFPSGAKIWYLNGVKQAGLYIGPGAKRTWKDGHDKIHRDDGPAVEHEDGRLDWYQHGKRHRVGAPAIIVPDGTEYWYQNDVLSRLGGPAVDMSGGHKEWYIDGVPFKNANAYWKWVFDKTDLDTKSLAEIITTLESYNLFNEYPLELPAINIVLTKLQQRIQKDGVPDVDMPFLRRLPVTWLNQLALPHDVISALNEQAREQSKSNKIKKIFQVQHMKRMAQSGVNTQPQKKDRYGNISYWLDGKLHREDGPAVERKNGDKIWWWHGKLHRDNGPAIEKEDGSQEWWIHGVPQAFKVVHQEGNEEKQKTHIEWEDAERKLHRDDGPAIEYPEAFNSHKEWWTHGKLNRDGAPAVVDNAGLEKWYVNGELHRIGGPAFTHRDGSQEYWLHNQRIIDPDDYWLQMTNYVNLKSDSLTEILQELEKYRLTTAPTNLMCTKMILRYLQVNINTHGVQDDAIPWLRKLPHEWLTKLVLPSEIVAKLNDRSSIQVQPTKIKKFFSTQKPVCVAQQANVQTNPSPNDDNFWENDFGDKFWENALGLPHRLNGPAMELANGTREWWVNGKKHREDGPAVEFPNGDKQWWFNGVLIQKCYRSGNVIVWEDNNGEKHREDGPAMEYDDGQKEWWQHGQMHRDDGYAFIDANNLRAWYQHGKLHRTDGPSYVADNGYEAWYINGVQHRIGGPAVTYPNGIGGTERGDFYINGIRYTDEGKYWKDVLSEIGCTKTNLKTVLTSSPKPLTNLVDTLQAYDVFDNLEPTTQHANIILKTMQTIVDNKKCSLEEIRKIPHDWLTKLNLSPEMITTLNTPQVHNQHSPIKKFFSATTSAAPDTPTIKDVDPNGNITYRKDGVLHRDDGPAVERGNGSQQEWMLYGKRHRNGGPAVTTDYGHEEWWSNDRRHRLDGPAVIWPGGSKEWWQYGLRHRNDGPAVEYDDGHYDWYWHGEKMTKETYWRYATEFSYDSDSLADVINDLYKRNYFKYNPDPSLPDCGVAANVGLSSRPVANDADIAALKKLPYEWLIQLKLDPAHIEAINKHDNKPTRKFFSVSLPVLQAQ